MTTICRLDIKLYSVVTPDITTDEVVLTDERIAHVKQRHPDDYERYICYLTQAVKQPDYIIEFGRPNTAVVLKQIEGNDSQNLKLILKLHTINDDVGYKNSVITFWKVHEKE